MKFLVAFVVIAFAACVYGLTEEEEWAKFKVDFDRHYSEDEDRTRFGIFKAFLAKVNAHNAKYDQGLKTWKAGLNQFADMTEEEHSIRKGFRSNDGPV